MTPVKITDDDSGLKKLISNLKTLNGEHKVSFVEFFPPEFMRRYTDFGTIEEMLQASGYDITTAEDFDKIPEETWDPFVGQRTRFSDWEEMRGKAGEEWTLRKMEL